MFYAPFAQKAEIMKFLSFNLVARTEQAPLTVVRAISTQIHQLDRNQVLARISSMDDVVAKSLAPRRVPVWLMGVFSGIALFLAAIGIYGVLSYYVLQRRQEIGLRMALGAQRANVLQLILGHAAKLIAAGVAIGLVAALAASRVLTSMLFGVKPTDIPTFLGVSLLLAALALLACAIPASRATRVDPLVVLRNE